MVSMASNLMLADERVLWMAQREAMACSRIVACLQKIAVYRLASAQAFSLVSHINSVVMFLQDISHADDVNDMNDNSVLSFQTSPNIALEAHSVRANEWNGMSCMLFQRLSPERTPNQDRQLTFKCNTTSSISSILYKVSSRQRCLLLSEL